MSDLNRPEWKHAISEDDVRWLSQPIAKIVQRWKFISEDETEEWIELYTRDDKKRDFYCGILSENGYFKFHASYSGLIRPTYKGEQAQKKLEEIEAWERKNKRDRRELERLKRKFGEDGHE